MIRAFVCLLATTIAFSVAPLSYAAEKDGVKIPNEITVDGNKLRLNGMGTREATIFSINVYVAGLYVPRLSNDAHLLMFSDVPKKLVLHFVRGVDGEDIREAFEESFARNKFGEDAKAKLVKLNQWMPDMKKGDNVAFTYLPGKGLAVEVNGVARGVIEGKEFQASFLSIWLGKNPPNSGLKKGLLGKG